MPANDVHDPNAMAGNARSAAANARRFRDTCCKEMRHMWIPLRLQNRQYPHTPITLYPQSTYSTCPVIAEASGLHKKTVALPTSSGVTPLGNGERWAA